MRSTRNSRQAGYALTIVLGVLIIFGASAITLLSLASSRQHAIDTLEARLESVRLALAYRDALRSNAMSAYSSGGAPSTSVAVPFNPRVWDTPSYAISPGDAFPSAILSTPRPTPAATDRDPSSPASLPWLVRQSECVHAKASIALKRPSRYSADAELPLTVTVDAAIWRIPAAEVSLLVSDAAATFAFPVDVDGPVALAYSGSSDLGQPNLAAPEGYLFANSAKLKITAGPNSSQQIHDIYGLGPSSSPAAQKSLDAPEDGGGGIVSVTVDGVSMFGIDLATYNGPSSLAVRGSAVQAGFVILGSTGSRFNSPVSVAVDGPVILAGSNSRFVLCASTSAVVAVYSRASRGSEPDAWVVSGGGSAGATSWLGHVFIAAANPQIRLQEDWSRATFTLRGSLHITAGLFSQSGSGAGSLQALYVRRPPLGAMPADVYVGQARHESFLVCPL